MNESSMLSKIISLLQSFFPSSKPDYNKALIYFEKKNFIAVMKHLIPLATDGNIKAQFLIGCIYEDLEKNNGEAHRWYLLAANNGHVGAQARLGAAYIKGNLVPNDYKKAIKWLKLAIEKGDLTSHYNLGRLYLNGQGVRENIDEALRLLKIASKELPEAQNKVGEIFHHHKFDFKSAYKWYKKSADNYKLGKHNLAFLYYYGMGVKKNYNEAFKYFSLSANDGLLDSTFYLAKLHEKGQGTFLDLILSYKWYYVCFNYLKSNDAKIAMDRLSNYLNKNDINKAQKKANEYIKYLMKMENREINIKENLNRFKRLDYI